MARALRRLDRALASLEQLVLAALLAIIICVAVATVAVHLAWADEVIRYGVFAMAMIGGAFATHHQRLLSMDVLSRTLPPRGRAALRVVLALFALGATAALFVGGLQILALQRAVSTNGFIPTEVPALCIPVGTGLIAVHLTLGAAIELDYLARGRSAPEPEQGGV